MDWLTPAGVWTGVVLIFHFGRKLQALEDAAAHARRVPDVERAHAVLEERVDAHINNAALHRAAARA